MKTKSILLTCLTTLTLSCNPDAVRAAVPDGLVGYWNFDEGTGAVLVDNSGSGNDGALYNFPGDDSQWSTGRIGGALCFRGAPSGDHVIVPNYPKPTTTMTLSAWARADSHPVWGSIAKNWGGANPGQFHFGFNAGSGRLSNYQIEADGGLFTTAEGPQFPLGSWQHVAFVCDGSMMRIYRNGVQVAVTSYDGTILPAPLMSSLAIGCKTSDSGTAPDPSNPGFWHGKMDDLGLWHRGLSAEEILAIYTAGVNGRPLTDAVVGAVRPVIVTQPQDQTTGEGGNATFTVTASGTAPLAYQWRKDGTAIPGATESSLTVSNLCTADAGNFTVIVCNAAGCVTSAPPATLTITPLLARPITDGLVGHWKFDEASGSTASDGTASANHGALNNYPGDNSQWMPGQIGGALNFGGPAAQQWVYVANYPKPTTTMTISAWVLANSRPVWASIAKNWGGPPEGFTGQFHLGLNSGDGTLSNYQTENDGGVFVANEGTQFPLGAWQHVAFTCDGSVMRLYRNGAEVASSPYDGTILNSPVMSSLGIGCKTGSSGLAPDAEFPGFWDGKMDDLGLWNRGLSAADILTIYNAGLEGRSLSEAGQITSGLAGHWKFDEAAGATASDATANANHGALSNYPGDNSQWMAGQIGGALNFGGPPSQQWVYVANYPKPTTKMTISAWVLANSGLRWASIAKNWGGGSPGQFHFGINDNDGDLSNYQIENDGGLFLTRENTPFPLGAWQHVAFVCDGSQMRIYRNGAQVASTPYDGTILNAPAMSSLAIGCKTDDSGLTPDAGVPGFWDGKMDDLGLWTRGLSASEIQTIYTAGLEGRSLSEAGGLPRLSIVRSGGNAIISWAAASGGGCFVLECSDVLPATTWSPAGAASLVGNRYSVTVNAASGNKFFRLRK